MRFADKISIAALLHDIGKFYQRTGLELKDKNNYAYCPKEGRSHIHSAYTAEFFDDFEKNFEIFNNISNEDNENILNLSAYHHKPSSPNELIIAEADRLASGFDRRNYDKYNDLSEEETKNQEKFNNARLLSPFSRLYVGENDKKLKLEDKFYEIDELIPKNIFPKYLKDLNLDNNVSSVERYKTLWDKFKTDLEKIEFNSAAESFNNYYQSLLYILERYTAFIPSSSYKTVADISLFDHSKITSAIALALYLFQKNSNNFDEKSIENRNEEKYLIIQGDFSGIQRFIFDRFGESNKFAAKILRAKSLFVSAFTELTASYICTKAGANNSSILLNAGGKFILILPNTKETADIVDNIKKDINNNFLYETTFSQTVFNVAKIPLCGSDFEMGEAGKPGKFSYKMKLLAEKLELEKIKPQIESGKYIFSSFLNNVSNAGGVCEICGIRHIETHKNIGNEKIGLCRFDEVSIDNGESLVKNDFIIFKTDLFRNVIENKSKKEYGFIDFAKISGNKNSALNKKYDKEDIVYDIRGTYDPDGKFLEFLGFAKKSYKAYVPVFENSDIDNIKYDDIPKDDRNEDIKYDGIKLFNYISRDGRNVIKEGGEVKYVGVPHLAALKGDIDNAGQIFINGFKKNSSDAENHEDIYTISRLSMLSRMFDYFFGVWLPHKLSRESFKSIYTIFAGGDDLFLIGPWNQIIKLSQLISEKIKELSGNNEAVHISIGISLAKSNVPIYKLADEAEEELEKAKKIDEKKNAVSVFGKTLKWEDFYKVFELEKYFGSLLDDKNEGVSIGYIYKIIKFVEMNEIIKNCIKKGGIDLNLLYENAKWRSMFRYITYRNYHDKSKKELLEKLNFIPEYIEKYGVNLMIPISYAIYERRD
jgi:CRISPR-associated protein Csm1